MTKWIALPAAFVAVAALTLNVEAAPKTNAKPNSPKTTTKPATKGQSTKGSSTTTKGPSTKGPSTKSAGTTKTKGPKSTTTTTTTAKGNGASKKKSGSTTTASTSTTSTSPTTTTTEWKPTNAVAEKLMNKPNQLAKLKAVLGDSTIDINDATAGFKNFGQLNAAVNVSQNLGIDFADLKAAMTGITIDGEKTNQPTKSLGQAIQLYRTDVDAEAEAAAATAQATRDGGQ
jgi:hypothetical protein